MVVVTQSMFTMKAIGALAIPLTTVFALAVLLGLVTEAVRVDGMLSVVVVLLGCAIVAAAVSSALEGVRGVIAGAAAGATLLPILFVIKAIRWPDAPILGDDAGVVALLLFAAATVAAIVGAVGARHGGVDASSG